MPDKTAFEKMVVKNAKALAVLNDGSEHAALLAQLPAERLARDGENADWLLLFARSRAELSSICRWRRRAWCPAARSGWRTARVARRRAATSTATISAVLRKQ